ncbi:hypothetical protein HY404_01725 [Candidatus Microgenomates bacterium]|nr:hypothetical protein [Candidatus Microgenomates bacterium]
MSTKEVRREIIASGSALRKHSLNQFVLKKTREGIRKLDIIYGSDSNPNENETGAEFTVEVPLSSQFLERFSPPMLELARQRIASEDDKTIPQRIGTIVQDAEKLHRLAQKANLATQVIHPDYLNGEVIEVPLKNNHSSYSAPFPYQNFLTNLRKLPYWRLIDNNYQGSLVNIWPRYFMANLTACDFTLMGNELLTDRIDTYAHVLATLDGLIHVFSNKNYGQDLPLIFLEVAKKHFRQ